MDRLLAGWRRLGLADNGWAAAGLLVLRRPLPQRTGAAAAHQVRHHPRGGDAACRRGAEVLERWRTRTDP